MKIESLDFFYVSMPTVEDIGDGSQDALLVRVRAGGYEGWGECEAAPLPTIAAMICPMSHSACKPVVASVLGQPLDKPADIFRVHQLVRENSMDLLQTDHALSGIDIAFWDLLGKKHQQPVYELLGYKKSYPKVPYASFLFGDTPQETFAKARHAAQQGYRAIKCGWGPFGKGSLQEDIAQVAAAREGLGQDNYLLVDVGTVWGRDVALAQTRLEMLEEHKVTWLEEPFHNGALDAYLALSKISKVKLAGGEGAHNEFMAQHMIDYGGVGFIQIDAGRVGGLTSAKRVADYAAQKQVTYVNHTFTSHLALSASLQPYAGLKDHQICEYPIELKPLAYELTQTHINLDPNGEIALPEKPGLGMELNMEALKKYLVQTEIIVNKKVLYQTPEL